MSRSPRDALTISLQSDYLESTRLLDRMVRAGFSWSGKERDVALLNTGVTDGIVRFADVSAVSGFHDAGDGRAIGLVDWDRDGDIDAWLMSRTAPQLQFWENQTCSPQDPRTPYLMILLEGDGQQVPRAATGARAELLVASNQPRSVRTVRTGDTHCSQSTHWLHFGLGNTAPSQHLTLQVTWPNGQTASFANLTPNRHYRIPYGGQPEALETTKASQPPAIPRTPMPASSRVTLYSNRLPVPQFTWRDSAGKHRELKEFRGKHVAVILWASWCGNCVQELSALPQRADFLRREKITVIGMNIDRVEAAVAPDDDAGADGSADELWATTGVDGTLAFATADTMRRLEAFHAALHWIGGPLRIPGLFLFDADGRIVAHAEGILEDEDWNRLAQALRAPDSAWLKMALPFPGRQYGKLAPLRIADLPQHLMEDDAFDLAAEYLADHEKVLEAQYRAQREPGLPRVLYTLGVQQAKQQDRTAALALYRKAVALRPNYVDARYNLAGLLREMGEPRAAFEQYSAIVSNFPDHAASWHNRALLRQEAGDLEGAVADYRHALQHAPGSLDSLNNLGNALSALQRHEEAQRVFAEALAKAPRDSRTLYNQALAYELAGRLADALAAYRRAVDLEPQNAQYAHNLGVLFAKQAQWQDARHWLQRAIELDPNHPTAQRNLERVKQFEARQ